jgi:four helix bundle protein
MFEKLDVYQKAVDFADEVVDLLTRAPVSTPTNLAEAHGRFTKPDRRHFFTIARGSAQECVPLLELARRRGLLTDGDHTALRDDLEVIAKMISGLIAGIEKRAK